MVQYSGKCPARGANGDARSSEVIDDGADVCKDRSHVYYAMCGGKDRRFANRFDAAAVAGFHIGRFEFVYAEVGMTSVLLTLAFARRETRRHAKAATIASR